MKRKYEQLNSRDVFSGYSFRVVTDEIRLPTGKRTARDVIRHPGAVVIIPRLTNGSFLLVEQYRYAIGCDLLEFPAGTLEPKEDPLECAKREIKEEVKHRADRWTDLGIAYPAPGFCDELQHFYLADDLSPEAEDGDEDEIMDVVELTLAQIEDAIKSGSLIDAKSIAIFCRARMQGLL